jgi:hypothetical protein
MARRSPAEDDDSNIRAANQKAVEEIERAERETPAEEEPTGNTIIELDDEEDEEEPLGVQATPGRSAERRNRYREQKEGREKAERDLAEMRQKHAELEGRIQQLQVQPAPQQGAPQQHPAIAREADLRRQMTELSEDFEMLQPEAKQKPEVRKRYTERFQALQSEQQRVNAYIATGGQVNNPQADQQRQMQTMLTARYPDVMGTDQHFQYADATYKRLRAAGSPDNWDTIDKAMEETRRQFRLGKSPPPSAATRARFSGVSAGASGSRDTQSGPVKIELTAADRVMARAAFPKLKPQESYKEFAKMLRKGQNGAART